MKKEIEFEEAVKRNRERFVKVLPHVAGSRKPRTKPRNVDESEGISITTAEIVQQAFKSGKLRRSIPKGFVLK